MDLVKIINEETKEVLVANAEQEEIFLEQGFSYMEIEESFEGKFYIKGYAPQKPLEELKLAKRAEINKARDAAEQGGFEYMGKVFDSDPVSCQRISCAAQAMALADDTATITWTCQDNTTIDLTAQELLGLVVALTEWSNTCHQKATALKAQIEACQTKEELDKIVWNDVD